MFYAAFQDAATKKVGYVFSVLQPTVCYYLLFIVNDDNIILLSSFLELIILQIFRYLRPSNFLLYLYLRTDSLSVLLIYSLNVDILCQFQLSLLYALHSIDLPSFNVAKPTWKWTAFTHHGLSEKTRQPMKTEDTLTSQSDWPTTTLLLALSENRLS